MFANQVSSEAHMVHQIKLDYLNCGVVGVMFDCMVEIWLSQKNKREKFYYFEH